MPLAPDSRAIELDDATRAAVDEGRIEVITETQLWQRLGLVEAEQHVHRLYTPAMLAELLQVPVAIVRRWHRRGLIVPRREVRRLPYFDFQEVATARRLAELLAAGMSPQAIEKKLAELARYRARHRTAAGSVVGDRRGKASAAAARRRADCAGRTALVRFSAGGRIGGD